MRRPASGAAVMDTRDAHVERLRVRPSCRAPPTPRGCGGPSGPRLVSRADAGLGRTRPEASRSQDHVTSGRAWERGPSGHSARLGLPVDVAHAPPPSAALYERVTQLSAPWMTSTAITRDLERPTAREGMRRGHGRRPEEVTLTPKR